MHQFNASPLPMVWLLNGFHVSESDDNLVRYDRLQALTHALRAAVVLKPSLLNADEIVYLRRALDLSQTELADLIGTTPQTLSLWERGSHSISRSADTVLRRHCSEQRSAFPSSRLRKCTTSALARFAKNFGDFLFEGSIHGGEWFFECRPTPSLRSSKQTSVVATFADMDAEEARSRARTALKTGAVHTYVLDSGDQSGAQWTQGEGAASIFWEPSQILVREATNG